jgi:hypothetical protein
LPGVNGVYQVDADRLRLQANHGVWRCASCRRRITRPHAVQQMPGLALRMARSNSCSEDPDNYDLQLLDQGYSMLRPEEHTAMVPHDERERLENLFKGDSDALNTFVCTPTLELGVDIGQLDAVLMRNVPPLPANYWQRAGRAGRRHRMAVEHHLLPAGCRTTARIFNDPLKLLAGRVDPPAFNLRNEPMVARHVHATAITRLHQYTLDPTRTAAERQTIATVLKSCLPDRVSPYLFDDGVLRTALFDLAPCDNCSRPIWMISAAMWRAHLARDGLLQDAEVTAPAELHRHVATMVEDLEQVLLRLSRRLRWALDQIRRLNTVREAQGTLEPEDDALFHRCDALVKRLKGTSRAQSTAKPKATTT